MSNMVNVNEEWATLCKTVASLFHQQSFFLLNGFWKRRCVGQRQPTVMNLLRILWSLIDDLDFGKILHEKMYCYFVFFLETLGLLQDAT